MILFTIKRGDVNLKTIKEHIKNKNFSNIYILYGDEKYTKDIYKKKLIEGILTE